MGLTTIRASEYRSLDLGSEFWCRIVLRTQDEKPLECATRFMTHTEVLKSGVLAPNDISHNTGIYDLTMGEASISFRLRRDALARISYSKEEVPFLNKDRW